MNVMSFAQTDFMKTQSNSMLETVSTVQFQQEDARCRFALWGLQAENENIHN